MEESPYRLTYTSSSSNIRRPPIQVLPKTTPVASAVKHEKGSGWYGCLTSAVLT
uniref:Uncharacterized protein n=1 Tax=Anguilla anguilla TaxID=7936 RepID=A0A0E9UUV9_ANGAN